MKKAAAYFGKVLVANNKQFLAATVAGVSLVVAIDDQGERLRKLIEDDKFFGESGHMDKPPAPTSRIVGPLTPDSEGQGASTGQPSSPATATSASDTLPDPEPEPVLVESLAQFDETFGPPTGPLIPLYHVPGSQVWEGSRGRAAGNVHLHVTSDMQLGRRTRQKGECLCSKKHGSYERPPTGEKTMCAECVKVADDNGLSWTLTDTLTGA